MVRIRYRELPVGLHVTTETQGGCTTVFLQPGLTREQRKQALTVARRSARLGHGPSLPAIDMALAVAADQTRMTARVVGVVMRKHPLLILPLIAVVAALIVILTVSFLPASAPGRVLLPVPSVPSGGYLQPDGPWSPGVGQTTHEPAPVAIDAPAPRVTLTADQPPAPRVHHGRGPGPHPRGNSTFASGRGSRHPAHIA